MLSFSPLREREVALEFSNQPSLLNQYLKECSRSSLTDNCRASSLSGKLMNSNPIGLLHLGHSPFAVRYRCRPQCGHSAVSRKTKIGWSMDIVVPLNEEGV